MMALKRGQTIKRDNLVRNGSAGRADWSAHAGSCAGGSLRLTMAVMTDSSGNQAIVGAEKDYQVPLTVSFRKEEALGS